MREVPGAVVKHAHHLTVSSFLQQHFRYGQGAFTYHSLRVETNSDRFSVQPLSFYTDMLRVPWRTASGWNAWIGAILLVLSQGANAAGFLYQAFQPGSDMMALLKSTET